MQKRNKIEPFEKWLVKSGLRKIVPSKGEAFDPQSVTRSGWHQGKRRYMLSGIEKRWWIMSSFRLVIAN